MKILDYEKSKSEEQEIHYINRYNVYISVTDYGLKKLLKEVVISPGNHIWTWIPLQEEKYINLTDKETNYFSFDEAVNREVRDNYSIVYNFDNYKEMANHWNDIVYKDKKLTLYQSEEKENG